VRSQLITLLGLLASPSALEALIALLGDMDAVVRAAVNQAFVLAGSPALSLLQRALERGDERVRWRGGGVLTLLGGEATDTALALLANPDSAQRATAAATLGALRVLRAEGALIEHLADKANLVRIAVIAALGKLGTPAARAALRQQLKAPE